MRAKIGEPRARYGMPLDDALSLARALGFKVWQPTANGEWMVGKAGEAPVRVSVRRRDASKKLVVVLRQAERRAGAQG